MGKGYASYADAPGGNSEKNTPLKFVKKPKKPNKSTKKKKGKTVSISKKRNLTRRNLTPTMKSKLIAHGANHSMAHINFMRSKIENGAKFSEAHMLAMTHKGS